MNKMSLFSKERRENKKLKRANWKKQKKEMRLKRKEERKLKREAIKELYADAPFLTRFLHLNGKIMFKICIWTIVTPVLLLLLWVLVDDKIESAKLNRDNEYIDELLKAEPDLEKVYALSPLDEEGADRISKIPGNNPDDTWTFCVYFVGSNLEDIDENDLSSYVQMITSQIAQENDEKCIRENSERIERYASEINANGLDVPEYFYKVQKPIASSTVLTSDVVVAEESGAAFDDIMEMCEYELPDNITIVLQTGGATRWSNVLINPNKTQRFVIKNGIMSEVSNMHIQDSCNPDTMADFITFCDKNYKSDHMAMILWDHGGGVSGFGMDSIYRSNMALADLKEAFSKAIKKDVNKPYFDFIGFDACLMAATDTAVALDGYGKYLVASEESEPGFGWDHGAWLKALADDPTMSAAAVGQAIADSYMNFYMKLDSDPIWPSYGRDFVVTFSVVDMHKAAQVDAAYEAMNEKFLKKVVDDPSVLIDMSRAAKKTMRYAGSDYKYFNTIDLGTYLDYLSELYPDECAEVRKLLKEAVLYKRGYSYLDGSQGLSVYFPVDMDESYCLSLFTDYVYNISDKKSTNALYYYKVAGCLNDEFNEYVTELTGKSIKVLDTKAFYDYQDIIPEINSDNQIVIPIGEELETSIQSAYVEIDGYDEDGDTITYYGSDDCYYYDGEGNIVVDVDGSWFALDGVLLNAEFSFGTDITSTYVAKVLHNGVPSYMTFTLNDESEEISINSVVKIPEGEGFEYASTLKSNTKLSQGDTIAPIFTVHNSDGQEYYETYGTEITYQGTSGIKLIDLPEGKYFQTLVIKDMRGDEYYSPVVETYFKKGKVSEIGVNPRFVGMSNYYLP